MTVSKAQYHVIASATFEKQYKKLLPHDRDIRELFAAALAQLEKDPTRGRSIKKLVGIAKGDGAWRIRLGIYRARYDISGMTVLLHTIGLRKEIYRRK
jgi:mRNA-degrading endonuclease RelE of RelBE toxin-antitoxin system